LCPIESIVINPIQATPSELPLLGDAILITFSATAMDIGPYGSLVDISEDIVWTDQDNDVLCDGNVDNC